MLMCSLLERSRDTSGSSRWSFACLPPGSRPEGTESRATRGWRTLRKGYMAPDPRVRAGGSFREYKLNASEPCVPNLDDSVLVLPDLVSEAECALLRAAADRWCEDNPHCTPADRHSDYHKRHGLMRVECHVDGLNLDGSAHALSRIILARALWNFETLRPSDAHFVFRQRASLGDMVFSFSGHEPAINCYTAGGEFEPHEDKHMLTILVPLSPPGAFEGGGTGFWSERAPRVGGPGGEPSLTLRPEAGTALLWTGQITHAGLPVISGRRHVWVCSFNLRA